MEQHTAALKRHFEDKLSALEAEYGTQNKTRSKFAYRFGAVESTLASIAQLIDDRRMKLLDNHPVGADEMKRALVDNLRDQPPADDGRPAKKSKKEKR